MSADRKLRRRAHGRRKPGAIKKAWARIRGPLSRNETVQSLLVRLIAGYLKFVDRTNPRMAESADADAYVRDYAPFVVALWHGQHLMGPFMRPEGLEMVALFSKSADAELNARVSERLGFETVRGSGGRYRSKTVSKGGVSALLSLRRALKHGKSVAMIADIVKGKTREAGPGIILLAKLSGRPIIPAAYASSRRRIIEKSWDKTVIPLPFGRAAVVAEEPVIVPADADEAMLEAKRIELTRKLNDVTDRAYHLVDGRK